MAQSSPSPSSWASSLHSKSQGTAFRIPGPSTRFHKEHKKQEQLRQQQQQQQAQLQQQQQQQLQQQQQQLESPRPKYTRFSSVGAYEPPSTRTRSRLSISPSNVSSSSIPVRSEHLSHRKSSSHSFWMAQSAPLTPVRSPHHHILVDYNDSPYSDYFTDENRSMSDRAQYTPTSSSQKLLVRLNTIGQEILRQDLSGSTSSDLEAKLDDFEHVLGTNPAAAAARSACSSRLGESGLYISGTDDDQDLRATPSGPSPADHSARPSTPLAGDASADHIPTAVKARLRNQERLLKEAQDVLQRVSKANDSLRKRYEEIRQIHDNTVLELEECAQEALILKSENDGLKADLGFDHSELLFMKLQLKALEVEADAIADQLVDGSDLSKKRVLVNDDIERWKADWDHVDARLRARRERHLVISTTPDKLSAARDRPKTEELGEWHLGLCKKRHGKLQSITIKRLNSTHSPDEDEDDELNEIPLEGPVFAPLPPLPLYCEQTTQTEESIITTSELEQMIADAEAQAQVAGLARVEQNDYDATGEAEEDEEEDDDDDDDEGARNGLDDEIEDDDDDTVSSLHDDEDNPDKVRHGRGELSPTQTQSPKKTAWQELCDSLVSFAGMDRD